MNLQRREEIRAIAKEFRRLFLHEQAEAIDELLAHIATLEQAAAERVIADGSRGSGVMTAVVAPELTDTDIDAIWRDTEDIGDAARAMARWAYSLAASRARAIPANRVPGEGMVAVDSLLYAALINLEKAVVREWGLCCTGDRLWNGQKAIADRRDALRANQGGA